MQMQKNAIKMFSNSKKFSKVDYVEHQEAAAYTLMLRRISEKFLVIEKIFIPRTFF